MASLLETVGYLVLGGAIGWWIKQRFFAPVVPESKLERLSCEWRDHLEAHAKAMEGSVALTAPVMMVSRAFEADQIARVFSVPLSAVRHDP